MNKTILIADDHPFIIQGMLEFFRFKRYEIVDTASNGNEALNKIIKTQPDFAILDFEMPNLTGVEVAHEVKRNEIETKIILLTLHKQNSLVEEVGKTIDAYITKDSALQELESCLIDLENGKNYLGKKLSENIHMDVSKPEAMNTLTTSELKIMKMLEKNMTSAEIAEQLFISKRTVDKHRSNIIKKLELDSTRPNALLLWLKNHPDLFQ